jgi:hypothetical protein
MDQRRLTPGLCLAVLRRAPIAGALRGAREHSAETS